MDFGQMLARDQVHTLPLRTPPTITAQTPVADAITNMQEAGLGCAVIVDAMHRPGGIFTERSLLEILDEGKDLRTCVAGDFTDPNFLTVRRDQPISIVWIAICLEQARFMCVIDEEGQLVGLTGQRGLSEYVSECFPWQVAVQRLGAKPWDEQREGA